MKQTKRRLLSLLMAFAILCTMIPAAFAEDGWTEWTGGGEGASSCEHKNVTTETTKKATCTETGEEKETCTTCGATRTKEIPMKEHTWDTKYGQNDTQHWQVCTVCGEAGEKSAHTWGDKWESDSNSHWHECTECHAKKEETAHTPSATLVNSKDGTEHVTKCEVCGYEISAEPHD